MSGLARSAEAAPSVRPSGRWLCLAHATPRPCRRGPTLDQAITPKRRALHRLTIPSQPLHSRANQLLPLLLPGGHRLLPGHTSVGTIACSCGRHLTWRCECGAVTYGPALAEGCSLLDGPRGCAASEHPTGMSGAGRHGGRARGLGPPPPIGLLSVVRGMPLPGRVHGRPRPAVGVRATVRPAI
jgi:hypothetical protein